MALNPLVSLFGRLGARSDRISGTGHGQTDGRTEALAAYARRGITYRKRKDEASTILVTTKFHSAICGTVHLTKEDE